MFKNTVLLICLAALISALLLLRQCQGCKKPNPPSLQQQLVQDQRPLLDSLLKSQAVYVRQIDSLEQVFQLAGKKQYAAMQAAQRTINKLKEALQRKDTPVIIDYAQECANDFADYVTATDAADSVQHQLITTQAHTIETQSLQIQVLNTRHQQLSSAYTIMELQNQQLAKALKRSERRRKAAAFVNKITVPATVAATTLLFFIIK